MFIIKYPELSLFIRVVKKWTQCLSAYHFSLKFVCSRRRNSITSIRGL